MFSIKVAMRFLTAKKTQTLFIILGFAIGISVNIFVGSLIQSLQNNLINTTVGNQPHIIITSIDPTKDIPIDEISGKLSDVSGIKSIAPIHDTRAFIINVNPESPDDVLLRGVDLENANEIYGFYDNGKFMGNKPNNDREIILGKNLMENLDLDLGDMLEMKLDPSPYKPNVTTKVVGYFDLGVDVINELWVLSDYNTVNEVANITDSKITSINIQVYDVFSADIIASEISEKISNNNLLIENWKDTNENLLNGLEAQSQSTLLIETFVLLAVVIGITSILGISVLQKRRQLGILKAMGLKNFNAALIFLVQGLFIGLLGSIFGVVIGFFLIYGFNNFAGVFEITLDLWLSIRTVIIAVISATVAATIPAKQSSKLEIIDIIRNN